MSRLYVLQRRYEILFYALRYISMRVLAIIRQFRLSEKSDGMAHSVWLSVWHLYDHHQHMTLIVAMENNLPLFNDDTASARKICHICVVYMLSTQRFRQTLILLVAVILAPTEATSQIRFIRCVYRCVGDILSSNRHPTAIQTLLYLYIRNNFHSVGRLPFKRKCSTSLH